MRTAIVPIFVPLPPRIYGNDWTFFADGRCHLGRFISRGFFGSHGLQGSALRFHADVAVPSEHLT